MSLPSRSLKKKTKEIHGSILIMTFYCFIKKNCWFPLAGVQFSLFEESYPSFDIRPEINQYGDDDARNHPLCLHRLRITQREDSSIFVVGRVHLSVRHGQTIRQSFHRPGNYLAIPP